MSASRQPTRPNADSRGLNWMSILPPAFGVRLVNSCRIDRLLAVPPLVGAGS
jgi:hypothetical protein